MSIYEAETLSEKIRYNTHYPKCMYESGSYNSFQQQNTILQRICNCYENMEKYNYNLIELKYENEIKEKELENECKLEDQKLGYIKEEYEYQLKIEKEYGDIIDDNKQKLEIIKLEINNEYKKLNQDISNLKKEIEELNSQKEEEITLMKKKIFEAEKEIKFNEMKNKAELVQKIISICKNITLK